MTWNTLQFRFVSIPLPTPAFGSSPSSPTAPDVFAPATLGPITLRNRIVKAATFEGKTPDGVVTQELIDYHLAPARGGVGMTTVAYLAVSAEGPTHGGGIVVKQRSAPGLAELAEKIHETGAAVSGQIGHAGPVANGRSNGARAVSSSRFFNPMGMKFVRPASEADITRVTRDYARAARTLVDAGFDALEIHMAHNYLLSSFLAPGINRRKDRWGGALENRARFARQVARAVRDEIGNDAAVYAKVSLNDGHAAGLKGREALEFAKLLQSDQNLDALQMTGGSSLMNPMYLFRGGAPVKEFANQMQQPMKLGLRVFGKGFMKKYPFEEGYFREKALGWRKELDLDLMLLGGINRTDTMHQAMADGFNFVTMGRALLYEPDLINRLQTEQDTTGHCLHCNRCMPTIYSPGGTHCPVLREQGGPLR